MFRVNEDGRFWLFLVLLVSCVSFIPLIVMSPGGLASFRILGFLITLIAIVAASGAGIIAEWKKIKRPEQKAQVEFLEIGTHSDGDIQSTNIKDMMNVTTCATFKFADETTHKLHFHSSKLEKLLPKYKNTSIEIYYKEFKGKYWLTGFDSASENQVDASQNSKGKINFKKPQSILSIIACILLLSVGGVFVTGSFDSLNDRINGKLQYSELEVKPLNEFYIECTATSPDGTTDLVVAENSEARYWATNGLEMLLIKNEDGNITDVYVKYPSQNFEKIEEDDEIEDAILYFEKFKDKLNPQHTFTEETWNYQKPVKSGTDKIADRDCVGYSFEGENGRWKLWLDQKTNFIMKLDMQVNEKNSSILVVKFKENGFEIPSYK